MNLIGVHSVFVPFEKQGKDWKKRDDLPRFLTSREAISYLIDHPWISWRNAPGEPNRRVILEWREHSEPDLIKEYVEGVGTHEFNNKRRKR